jgi:DNA-binding Lrp family transcriptional regulator
MAAIVKKVKEDRKVTFRLVADTLGIPKTVVLRILKEDLPHS